MAALSLTKEPYFFDPDFERAVIALCAMRTRFWSRIGHALDPDCVQLPGSKLALETCGLIAREVGHGPSSGLILVQRLRRLMNDGKITLNSVQEVTDAIDAAEDYGLPDEEDIIAELAPVLKRRIQSTAVIASHDEYAKKGDFKQVVDLIHRAERLGVTDTSVGTLVGPAAFAEIAAMSTLVRLPTGVLELDLQLADGLHRGGLGIVMGGAGDGKSMHLIHQAATAMARDQLFVGVATLELPKAVQLARLFANLTGVPTNQILVNAADRAEAERRVGYMMASGLVGPCLVEEFAPHATTVADIKDWCNRCADIHGRPFDLLVLDYGDKLHHPMKNDNEYERMKWVYEGLRRNIAVDLNMWVWTGSQAARGSKDQGKRLELHHVSDSMHKVRVADIVLTLNAREEGTQMLWFVAKNRLGKSRFQVGPVPTHFECARMVPAASEWVDWSQIP